MLQPMMPLADVIDFLDMSTMMKLYSPFILWPSFVAHPTNVSPERLDHGIRATCPSSSPSSRPQVDRAVLQAVLNKAEKVPTKVRAALAGMSADTLFLTKSM
jgi:hypothetical protein